MVAGPIHSLASPGIGCSGDEHSLLPKSIPTTRLVKFLSRQDTYEESKYLSRICRASSFKLALEQPACSNRRRECGGLTTNRLWVQSFSLSSQLCLRAWGAAATRTDIAAGCTSVGRRCFGTRWYISFGEVTLRQLFLRPICQVPWLLSNCKLASAHKRSVQ